MHSFQPSRGRTLFEVLCAMGMSASCAGAWQQTNASALLGASGIAGLFGLVRLFDVRRASPAKSIEPQRIDFTSEQPADVLAESEVVVPFAVAEPQAEVVSVAKGPRKKAARRASAPKKAKVAELVPADETAAAESLDELELAMASHEEADQPRIEPLFEPDPYFRQKRAAFGRRHTIS